MRELIKRNLSNYLRPRRWIFLIVAAIYGAGVVLGAVGVGLLNKEQVDYLTHLINNFLAQLQKVQVDDTAYTKEVLSTIWRDLGLIYFLSLSVIGLPGVAVIIFLRGFLLGFVLGFFIQAMALEGLLFASLSMIPQNLITIPVYIAAGVTAIELSWFIITRYRHFPKPPLRPYVARITTFMLVLAIIASMGGLVEV
ncbi:MAG TPA: stage II sporulation protein M, partial [Bacillota bacterium]|nr:stage II sporulation protein M [Bacillota bacterium]